MSVQLIDPNAKPVHERKDRSVGAMASIGVHALLILLLLYMAFPFGGGGGGTGGTEEGIPVDFGTSDFGAGDLAPTAIDPSQMPDPQEITAPPVTPVDQSEDEVLTADDPESFAIKNKEDKKKPVETPPVKETPKVTETPKQPVKETPKVNKEALFGGTKGTSNTSGSQGDDAPGTQGDKGKNNGTTGLYDGTGGNGSPGTGGGQGGGIGPGDGPGTGPGSGPGSGGVDVQLKNRTVKSKPVVQGKVQEAGKVVISITVNREGNVIAADCCTAKGTTLSNNALAIETAKTEAKKIKFNPDPTAAPQQFGTVTFTFVPR